MRSAFADAVIRHCNTPDQFFLTGDLGFMALENVRGVFGTRFVNTGVAEQNMIGVAAGLARENLKVFVYSIAPFCYARPFEQIRNDICMSGLPVCLVGNGGGYAYGHMGPTHHALEDCAAMSALGMRVVVPAFDEDVDAVLTNLNCPTYLRLGYDVRPKGTAVPSYSDWRLLLPGERGVLVALGPLGGAAWAAFADIPPHQRPAVWVVTEMPIVIVPNGVVLALDAGEPLIVIEEHVAQGGLGSQLLHALALRGHSVRRFIHRTALRYPSGRFGSQTYHRVECGLDQASLRALSEQL